MTLGTAIPCAKITMEPAKLPKFDPRWKDKCLTCKHVSTQLTGGSVEKNQSMVIRCMRTKGGSLHGAIDASAIGMRVEGGICGPEATLWEKK